MINLTTFKTIKTKKNYKSIFLYLALALILLSMIIYPECVSKGIKNGIDCCLNTLIPSMFPFMIISSILVMSAAKQNTKSLFEIITKSLFYLPGYTFPVILMSLFGGYPIGAYCTKHLYKNKLINHEQLNRMMSFCVNSGPAFIISVLGGSLLKSPETGLKLFLIQSISSILIGIFSAIIARFKKIPFNSIINTNRNNHLTFSNLLVDSCHNTCRSLASMCSLVTLFFGVTSLLNTLNLTEYASILLQKAHIPTSFSSILIASTLEITQACIIAAKKLYCPYWIYSWIIGFGGLCAHTQIIAEFKNCPFEYKKFLITRILNGILTAFVTTFIVPNPDLPLQTSSNLQKSFQITTSSPTRFGSIALLIFCAFFTLDSYLPYKQNLWKSKKH